MWGSFLEVFVPFPTYQAALGKFVVDILVVVDIFVFVVVVIVVVDLLILNISSHNEISENTECSQTFKWPTIIQIPICQVGANC